MQLQQVKKKYMIWIWYEWHRYEYDMNDTVMSMIWMTKIHEYDMSYEEMWTQLCTQVCVRLMIMAWVTWIVLNVMLYDLLCLYMYNYAFIHWAVSSPPIVFPFGW